MKVLFVKIFLLVLLILQISVDAQDKKPDIPNLIKVRIPPTDLPPGTTQQQSGDTSFFPSDPRNMWQYWEITPDFQTTPYVRINEVLSDTIIGGRLYQNYRMCRLIRYDPVERKLFGWSSNSDHLIADFSIETRYIYVVWIFGDEGSLNYHNYPASLEVLGEQREVRAFRYEAYGSSGVISDNEYAKGIGAFYLFYVSWGHGNVVIFTYSLRQAKIYDDTGVTLYYKQTTDNFTSRHLK
ncbi:MAG: hypothetical protein IPJ75_03640 [Ignavibacteriales bacterium]|nr:hypothetical protein [Ignavibacteriales bacterium]